MELNANTIESEAVALVNNFLAVAGPLEQMIPMLEMFLPEKEREAVDTVLRIIRALESEAPALIEGIRGIAHMERTIVDAINAK